MIVDCEMYYTPGPLAGVTFGLAGLEKQAREAGVTKAVVISDLGVKPDNRELADQLAASQATQGLFYGCAWINPQFGDEAVHELEVCVREWGFVALKLMPTHHAFRSVSTVPYPLMRKAEELGIPVTIHSGTFFCHPLEIGVLAEAFPKVPVIMDHMGYRYWCAEAIAAARRAPNLYLATTAVMEPHWIRQAVRALGAERVMFGSNAPHVWPSTQLLVVKQAELRDEEERLVLAENALRVFRLT